MNDVAIHLAFPDAALAYHCLGCDQRCCKTGSLVVFPQERPGLLLHHPPLELVAPVQSSGITAYAAPCSGCWFLKDGLCTLVNGPVRPLACSLFPWTLFGLHHQTLVVAPHPLCPTTVRPGEGTTHGEVLALLRKLGAAGAPPTPVRSQDSANALMLERVVRQAAQASLKDEHPARLAAFCDLATQAFVQGGTESLAAMNTHYLDAHIEQQHKWLNLWAQTLNIPLPPAASFASITPLVNAWMPSLRLFSFDATPLVLLPRTLLALSFFAAHGHAQNPQSALTPQALSQMAIALHERLQMLAQASLEAA